MFEIGDLIIYGSMGVCTILDICIPDVSGATKPCYLLNPHYFANTKVYAPMKNSSVSMREVMTSAETHQLIDSMPKISVFEEQDKAASMKTYRSALQSADGYLLAKLMKTLYQKREQKLEEKKVLPNQEKELLTTAETMLHGEMAQALDISIEHVPDYILSRISGSKKRVTGAAS